MTTGDEPMLPQPADDNSPMISGRGTKIIADARGAYLAGNLKALVEFMNEDQHKRFKALLWQEAVTVLRKTFHMVGLNDLTMHPVLEALDHTLTDPSEENTEQLVRMFSIFYDPVTEEDYSSPLIEEIYRITLDDLRPYRIGSCASDLINIIRGDSSWAATAFVTLIVHIWIVSTENEIPYNFEWTAISRQDAIQAAHRWSVETAWALLTSNRIRTFAKVAS